MDLTYFYSLDVESELAKLKEGKNKIKELEGKRHETIESQSRTFKTISSKFLPIFKYLVDERYNFYNVFGNYEYSSRKGPVLAFDSNKQMLYVFSVEKERIIGVKLDKNDSSITEVSYNWFFETYEFNDVMNGLKIAVELQRKIIDYLMDDINERSLTLEKNPS